MSQMSNPRRITRKWFLVVALAATVATLAATQVLTDLQRIEQAQLLLAPLKIRVTPEGVTNYENISTRLNTLKTQLLPVTPPPAPIPTPPPSPSTHAYFESLRGRPDCVVAHPLRSAAELDAMERRSKPYDPVTQPKRPIVYDPVEDAAMGTIQPDESTDTQQKWPAINMQPGESAFITFDMKLSPGFAYRNANDITRHKAQQLGGPRGAPWFTIRTFYSTAVGKGVAEWMMTSNAKIHVIPPIVSGSPTTVRSPSSEVIEPRLAAFFVQPSVWSRIAILLTDVSAVSSYTGESLSAIQRKRFPNGRVMRLSYWMSDENRAPVQILDQKLVLQPYERIALIRLPEFDTGQDVAPADTRVKYFWHRNLVQLRNPPAADIARLLQKPVR